MSDTGACGECHVSQTARREIWRNLYREMAEAHVLGREIIMTLEAKGMA